MTPEHFPSLIAAIFVVAVLYATVGHGGASGYIAVMSLYGLAPTTIKPTALILNIVVSSIGVWQFRRAGHFSWSLFWPFAALSVPLAFLGGSLSLPSHIFKGIVGVVLLCSAGRLLFRPVTNLNVAAPPRTAALLIGAGLGLLSGLTGTGGGIFLTPILLFMGWARPKAAAGVSALFILANSVAGLLGNVSSASEVPRFALPLALVASIGGVAGAYVGSTRLPHPAISRLLALVLLIAGAKLIFT